MKLACACRTHMFRPGGLFFGGNTRKTPERTIVARSSVSTLILAAFFSAPSARANTDAQAVDQETLTVGELHSFKASGETGITYHEGMSVAMVNGLHDNGANGWMPIDTESLRRKIRSLS